MSRRTAQFLPTEAPNLNALWAQVAFDEWARCGLSLAVVCPGSRSAPLAYAISNNPSIESIIAHDERAAGFVALGAARATGRAAVVVTTSGTAAANLLPAVIEASKTGTPMLVVTADRPPELHDCGANQSISQRGLFGAFARWSFEIPCAQTAIDGRWILSTADEVWQRAHTSSQCAGPVHVNWAFREPLAPRVEAWDRAAIEGLEEWSVGRERWRCSTSVGSSMDEMVQRVIDRIVESSQGGRRCVLCVGALYSPVMRSFARDLGNALACPVIADIGSGLRHGDSSNRVVAHGDLITLSGTAAAMLRPDIVVRVGGAISSKRIHEFLACARRLGAQEILIRDGPERMDSEHSASVEISIDASALLSRAPVRRTPTARRLECDQSFVEAWSSADAAVGRLLDAHLDPPHACVDEPSTARIVAALAPSESTLMLGNSMPIRDADMHAARSAAAPTIAVNRGASGIEGVIATAVGHARVTTRPSIVLLGDLALLHDIGSLALVRAAGAPVIIVVVNNDGGGIFHFLPVADHPTMLTPWTTTPHGLRFAAAAEMFGLRYHAPVLRSAVVQSLNEALHAAAGGTASSLIEVRTNRDENLQFHRSLQDAIRTHLDRGVVDSAVCVRAVADRT